MVVWLDKQSGQAVFDDFLKALHSRGYDRAHSPHALQRDRPEWLGPGGDEDDVSRFQCICYICGEAAEVTFGFEVQLDSWPANDVLRTTRHWP